eukprot:363607-Chlamydomonas_euryale.AAC.10
MPVASQHVDNILTWKASRFSPLPTGEPKKRASLPAARTDGASGPAGELALTEAGSPMVSRRLAADARRRARLSGELLYSGRLHADKSLNVWKLAAGNGLPCSVVATLQPQTSHNCDFGLVTMLKSKCGRQT